MPVSTPVYLDNTTVGGRDLRAVGGLGLQAGVLRAGDLAVTVSSGLTLSVAAGAGMVPDGQTRPTLYHAEAPTTTSLTCDAPSANPRLDQVCLDVYDPALGDTGSPRAELRIVKGIADSSATLDNRTGAATLRARSIRLADALVATNGTVTLRSRRPWAQGANYTIQTYKSNLTKSTAAREAMWPDYAVRVESSGNRFEITLNVSVKGPAGLWIIPEIIVDSTEWARTTPIMPVSDYHVPVTVFAPRTMTAGSHLVYAAWELSAAQQATALGFDYPSLKIREIVPDNAQNA